MKNIKIKSSTMKIQIISLVIDVFFGIIIYFLVPIIFAYPKNSLIPSFQLQIDQLTYIQQFFLMATMVIVFCFVIQRVFLNKIIKLEEKMYNNNISIEECTKLRIDCIKVPKNIYYLQVFLPVIIMILLFIKLNANIVAIVKIVTLCLTFFVLTGMLIKITTQKYYQNIIKKTFDIYNEQTNLNIRKESFHKKIFTQIIPLLLIVTLIITLMSYAKNNEEIGNGKYYYYQSKINSIQINGLNNIKRDIDKIEKKSENDTFYIFSTDKQQYYLKPQKTLSPFFILYSNTFISMGEGRVYDYYGVEAEGYIKKTNMNGENIIIGVRYETTQNMIYYLQVLVIVLIFAMLLLWIWSKNTSNNLSNVIEGLKSIAKGIRTQKDKILPILTNDEFGEISILYNNIQEIIDSQQEVLNKQGQLVILGELAGGVAHDINTPISAIKSGLLMLKDTAKNDDEKMLMSRMDSCADKIITLVNSLRNQIRNLGSDAKVPVNIASVIKDTSVIINNELVKSGVKLNMNIKDDLTVTGEPTKLGQVITNLVMNAIQAYGGEAGTVDVDLYKSANNEAIIAIEDYAGGIAEEVRPYIFKNILTTKGVSGTGFGLYLAYSVIKGSFGGEINFISTLGKGTRFYITIPLDSEV